MPLSQMSARQARGLRTIRSYVVMLGLVILVSLMMTILVACGVPSAQDINGPVVKTLDNAFQPQELHIKAGDTVTWLNEGQLTHTITADDKSFDSGDFEHGRTYSHVFTRPGRYPYYCIFHGNPGKGMAGVIIVDGTSGNTAEKREGSSDSASTTTTQRAIPQMPHATLRVPEDYPTISEAVKAARPDDLVSIGPGVYHEAVIVNNAGITIRGRDRNTVIMDGDFVLPNAFQITAENVIIENMTARHYKSNGFYWTGVKGYRGSYLTAYNNGDYGIYAYGSTQGQFDHSFASGQPDSGFYIGGCQPCHAVIANVISEGNALGYSGTNAGGDLVIRDSIWRNNLAGIVPNTLDSEPDAPQKGVTIINNLVENNNNDKAPTGSDEYPAGGNGIVLAGGNNNLVENNRVNGHQNYGIIVISNIDKNFWEPSNNTVRNNVVTNSGVADLALAALSAGDNCFSGNTAARTSPSFLQSTHACGTLFAAAGAGAPSATFNLLNRFLRVLMQRYTAGDWKTYPLPADAVQPGMPDPTIGLQGIFTPVERTSPYMTATSVTPGLTLAGLGMNNPFFTVLLGFYETYLPLGLYAAWLAIATWDIVRRTNMRESAKLGWLAIVFLIPVLGPLAYYLFGKSEISRTMRLGLVVVAPVVYLLISIVLLLTVS